MAANHLVSVVDASGGKVQGLEGHEGKVAEMWLKVPRRYAHLCRLFLASYACDASMDLAEFARGDWVMRSRDKLKKSRCKEVPRIVLTAQEEWIQNSEDGGMTQRCGVGGILPIS